MEDDITVSITGAKELQEALESIAGTESRKIVRAGLYAASKAIVETMTSASGVVPGEPGRMLSEATNWSKSVRMTRSDELGGNVHVHPKNALPEEHTGEGSPKTTFQPKGKKYHRSLAYLVKLMELGGSGGNYDGSRFPLMTATFASNTSLYVDRVLARIKEGLNKYGMK